MALMTPQAVTSIITPTFTTPTTSDTITFDEGLLLYVKVGGTATTITVVIPGNQPYSGTATSDLSSGSVTSQERVFYIAREAVDPATNLVTVTYSPGVTGVTSALLKV